MGYSTERLRQIFEKTDGRCHICRKQLAFSNYYVLGARGNWEVEHSNPRAKGGSDHLNNLYPACMSCNREKKDGTTAKARGINGFKKAPLSALKKQEVRGGNAAIGGALGLIAGVVLRSHPVGLAVLTVLGAVTAYNLNPDPE